MAYGCCGQSEGKCRSCGARILFLKTPKGRYMPVNPTVTRYKAVEGGKERVVLDDGSTIACTTDIEANQADGVGYISHFATCPNAKAHRKRK